MLRQDGSTTLLDMDSDCSSSTFGIICGKFGHGLLRPRLVGGSSIPEDAPLPFRVTSGGEAVPRDVVGP